MNNRLSKREELLDEEEEDFEANYPFTPAISNQSRIICEMNKQDPIYIRYQKYLDEREKKLKDMRQLKKREENAKIKKFLMIRNKQNQSIDRDIYRDNKKWLDLKNDKIRQEQARKLRNEINDPNLTFRPKINSKSKDALKYKSFTARQNYFKQKKDKKQDELIRKLPVYSFKPSLNKKSLKMADKKRNKDMRRAASAMININRNRSKEKVNVEYVPLKTIKGGRNQLPMTTAETVKIREFESPAPRVKAFEVTAEKEISQPSEKKFESTKKSSRKSSRRRTSPSPSVGKSQKRISPSPSVGRSQNRASPSPSPNTYRSKQKRDKSQEPPKNEVSFSELKTSTMKPVLTNNNGEKMGDISVSPVRKLKRRRKKRKKRKALKAPEPEEKIREGTLDKTVKKKKKKRKKKKVKKVKVGDEFSRVDKESTKKKKKRKGKGKKKVKGNLEKTGNTYTSRNLNATPSRVESAILKDLG